MRWASGAHPADASLTTLGSPTHQPCDTNSYTKVHQNAVACSPTRHKPTAPSHTRNRADSTVRQTKHPMWNGKGRILVYCFRCICINQPSCTCPAYLATTPKTLSKNQKQSPRRRPKLHRPNQHPALARKIYLYCNHTSPPCLDNAPAKSTPICPVTNDVSRSQTKPTAIQTRQAPGLTSYVRTQVSTLP
jgi:hypothetical protein